MSLGDFDTTGRFTDRVFYYQRYRPSYPPTLINYLDSQIGLVGKVIADIGAGTGIFSELLIERGALVKAVEPNDEMRQSAIQKMAKHSEFSSTSGTAEDTGLAAQSIDLITCAQAFHWFDPKRTRLEFDRILKKPHGRIALIWNDAITDQGVGQVYEQIKLRFGAEQYKAVTAITEQVDAAFAQFFGQHGYEEKYFDNFQELDLNGFVGRFLSSSYAPKPDSAFAKEAARALTDVFNRFESGGKVRLDYKTELFLGY